MDFSLSDEQQLLLASLKTFITRDFSEDYFRQCDESHSYPYKFLSAFVDSGMGLLGIPEKLGGVSTDMLTQILVLEETARLGAPAYLLTVGQRIQSMLSIGSASQLAKSTEAALTGIPPYALACTEPQAGSDSRRIATTYTRRNGKIYLKGQKTFITGAKDYPYMVVVARNAESENDTDCFTLWWVDARLPGIKCHDLHKIGWNMVSNCEVFFDDVEIEESDRVGEEGSGFIHVMKNFDHDRLVMAAYTLGAATCAFEDAIHYANQRVQFGNTLGEFQLTQLKLTQMAIKIQNMKHYVYRVAWEYDQGASIRLLSPLCKLYCAQAAGEVIDDAMQIMGALGYSSDSRLSRLWRDVRASRIGGGTDEIMVHISARQLLKQYKNN